MRISEQTQNRLERCAHLAATMGVVSVVGEEDFIDGLSSGVLKPATLNEKARTGQKKYTQTAQYFGRIENYHGKEIITFTDRELTDV